MKTVFRRRLLKSLSFFLALNIFTDVVFPSVAWALTDGPKQPEYSSFEPVATTNMVSDFDGSFTYNLPVVNIPGPDGSGYAMSLAYHSGNTSESEASWVGHGWTLNPGAINRNMQGVPDDYDGEGIQYYNKRKPNITATVGQKMGLEAFSIDLGVDFAYSYNNYRGFGTKLGVGSGVGYGMVSLGYTVSGQEPGSWKAEANAGAILKYITAAISKVKNAKNNKSKDKKTAKESEATKTSFAKRAVNKLGSATKRVIGGINFGLNAANFNMSTALNQYNNDRCFTINYEMALGIDPTLLHIGFEQGYKGSLSYLENKESFTSYKSGLLYSSKQDYSVEKESPYNLRDRYLPIPHKAKDQFMMTGEVLNGGFSLVNGDLATSETPSQNNRVVIQNGGFDSNVGLNLGVGMNVGLGVSTSNVGSFDYNFLTSTNTQPYFRFNNDMGGSVVFSNTNTHSFTSSIVAPQNGLGSVDYSNQNVSAIAERAGSNGYIGYTTLGDRSNTRKRIFSATKDDDALSLLTASGVSDSRIADIYSVNEDGGKLIYGLPVFVSNESQISEDVLEKGYFQSGVADIFIKNDPTVSTKLGHTNLSSYATSYLLTQINNSDYIDRTLDGPSNDDFGGWTKFAYRNPAYAVTNADKNFRFRMPYVGLSYDQGELTDREDDLGTCQSGTKEMYYLKYIETKTHIAFFITNKTNFVYKDVLTLQGSGNDRHDGIEAPSDGRATQGKTDDALKRAECLEKIVVYSKKDLLGKPLSVVNFEYDYTLSPGVLNHKCSTSGCEHGKLSLKKVWFEYEGVVNAKIAPYEFKYEYKLPAAYQDGNLYSKYTKVIEHGKDFTSADQNPDYHTWALDAWGNYRKDGQDQIALKQNGVKQSFDAHFDPAAWQLKQIKLPSGGEILIQYEQHDYQYVQNQKAMTMIKLDGKMGDEVFSINPEQLEGILVTDDPVATLANKVKYVAQLNDYLQKEKIYFKFLFRLIDDLSSGDVSINDCRNEYINGFANASAYLSDGKVVINVNETSGGDNYNTPKDVCKWFVKRKVAGKQLEENCALKDVDLIFPGNTAVPNPIVVGGKLISVFKSARQLAADDFNRYTSVACRDMSITYSYFRVPVFAAKKGGGVRVKRILMHDDGIETGADGVDNDEVLYGTEYFYENEDGMSSGVATNEPQAMREENALVRSLVQRNDPTWKQKMIAGVDRETFEGPLGEQLLPSPSIGYSRIVTQNIHTGKSNTGYKVSEFYTCKDFPFKAKNSSVRAPGSDKYTIPAVIVMVDVDRRAAAQSYQFIINDMHGKQKSIKTFRGVYDRTTYDPAKSTFSEIHEYYGLEEKVKVMDNTGVICDDYLGKEETVTAENRHARDEYMGMTTQFDMSIGLEFPPPVCLFQFSGMGYVGYSLKEFYTSVFNKTISVTAVKKSVTTTQDGITHVQAFKVFNKYTGKPIVTDTYDGYDGIVDMEQSPGTHNGTIRSHTIPAHYVYKGMGQKVQNEQMTFAGKTFTPSLNKLSVGTDSKYFTEGDLLALSSSGNYDMYYVDSKQGNDLTLVKLVRNSSVAAKVITSTGDVNVKIINSGYTNQLNYNAATVVTYGNSATIANGPSEVYNGTTNALKPAEHVLSSSVNIFSNNWVSSVVRGTETTDDDYSLGMKGMWRMKSEVVFNTTIKDAVTSTNRVYNDAGTYTLEPYYFAAANTNPKWIVSSLINTYSSDGNMLEDQNALGIKSSANFSHNNSVPSYISKNAPFGSCTFQSYEDDFTYGSSEKAHTGRRSLKLNGNSASNVTNMLLDVASKKKEILVRFWMNSTNDAMNDVNKYVRVNVSDISNTATVNPKLTKISQVGEWTLYEGSIRGLNNFTDQAFKVNISTLTATPVYIDDFRFQPVESEMICYAYDANSLRLVATFDDQHFGLLYQYNGEGKLVRKIVETERGVKTISETQYNTPKVAR